MEYKENCEAQCERLDWVVQAWFNQKLERIDQGDLVYTKFRY